MIDTKQNPYYSTYEEFASDIHAEFVNRGFSEEDAKIYAATDFKEQFQAQESAVETVDSFIHSADWE